VDLKLNKQLSELLTIKFVKNPHNNPIIIRNNIFDKKYTTLLLKTHSEIKNIICTIDIIQIKIKLTVNSLYKFILSYNVS